MKLEKFPTWIEIQIMLFSALAFWAMHLIIHPCLMLVPAYRAAASLPKGSNQSEWIRRVNSIRFGLSLPFLMYNYDFRSMKYQCNTVPLHSWDNFVYSIRTLWMYSLGYTLYDTIQMIWLLLPSKQQNGQRNAQAQKVGYEMLIHHLIMGISIYSQVDQPFREDAALLLLSAEFSSPFLNFRWILMRIKDYILQSNGTSQNLNNDKEDSGEQQKILPKWYSRLYLANGILLWLSFFVFRILTMPWFIYEMLTEQGYTTSYGQLAYASYLVIMGYMNLRWFSTITVKILSYVGIGRSKKPDQSSAKGRVNSRAANGGGKITNKKTQ
ncbi:hypothetical protein MIR68_001015 [Amoeboaphelidium protococcarum]|nr:hypothetical protein MIR68_001015 [Amoeboaphelidium protococcarum]